MGSQQQAIPVRQLIRIIVATVLSTLALLVLFSCDQKRPWGYFRLGTMAEVTEATSAPGAGGFREQVLTDKWLVIRRDAAGLSAMSTLCTLDLNPLIRSPLPDGSVEYRSPYNGSRYAADGTVLAGPAKHRLPFYKMSIDSGRYEGPKDTIYVTIGAEVSPDIRLPLP